MRKQRFVIFSFSLLLVASAGLSCGTGTSSLTGSILQSITVSPATADAQTYPDGEVRFSATGDYVNPARKVTPQPAQWGVCQNGATTTAATVSKTGVAQCAGGCQGQVHRLCV